MVHGELVSVTLQGPKGLLEGYGERIHVNHWGLAHSKGLINTSF